MSEAGAAIVREIQTGGLGSPDLLVQKIDPIRSAALVVRFVLSLDFDTVLADLVGAIGQAARHFRVELSAAYLASVAKHRCFTRRCPNTRIPPRYAPRSLPNRVRAMGEEGQRDILFELGKVLALEGAKMDFLNRTRLATARENLIRMWSIT